MRRCNKVVREWIAHICIVSPDITITSGAIDSAGMDLQSRITGACETFVNAIKDQCVAGSSELYAS